MRILLAILLIVPFVSGCRAMHISCKGKGKINVVGGPYGGVIEGDCGDGFTYDRDSERFSDPPAQPKP
jgi:hypothetical protein